MAFFLPQLQSPANYQQSEKPDLLQPFLFINPLVLDIISLETGILFPPNAVASHTSAFLWLFEQCKKSLKKVFQKYNSIATFIG
jgi:hypothetical protein